MNSHAKCPSQSKSTQLSPSTSLFQAIPVPISQFSLQIAQNSVSKCLSLVYSFSLKDLHRRQLGEGLFKDRRQIALHEVVFHDTD